MNRNDDLSRMYGKMSAMYFVFFQAINNMKSIQKGEALDHEKKEEK